MIKLVVTDIDGTLVDDNKNLSPDFWETIDRLFEKNIIFSVASGRQYHMLASQFARIKERTLFLAENGAYALHGNKELFFSTLNRDAANDFVKTGRKVSGAYSIFCCKDAAYYENDNEQFIAEASRYYGKLQRVNDLTQVEDTVLKFTMFDFDDSETHAFPHFKQYGTEYKVGPSGRHWLDITELTANKGTALRRAQEYLGVSFDETLVFGDHLNDLEMMREAKYSYAMKNAHPDVIKVSNFVTERDNNNHGVVHTIRKLCLGE